LALFCLSALPVSSNAGQEASPSQLHSAGMPETPAIPLPPEIQALPEQWHDKYRFYIRERDRLRLEMRAEIKALPDKDPERMMQAIETFREEHAERIKKIQDLDKAIENAVRKAGYETSVSTLSGKLQHSFARERAALTERQKELYEALQKARTEEERARIMAEYNRIQEEIKRELRERRAQSKEGP